MLENIESILQDACELDKNRLIIVGVSGGPDSLCLMGVLRDSGYSILIAHFNHHLRPEAEQEAREVEEHASRLNLEFEGGDAEVKTFARDEKLSIEEAARNLRYKFLFDLARDKHAQAVAVGHTAEDQVETVLMNFLRGSGLTGLKGMSHRTIVHRFDPHIPIVRPLLGVWRSQTVLYCTRHDLKPRYDASNESLDFHRNVIRHDLIPTLEIHNPKFRQAVFRMSESLKGDYEYMLELIDDAWAQVVIDSGGDFIAFNSSGLSSLSLGLKRNLIKRAVLSLLPDLDLDFSAIERACSYIANPYPSSGIEIMGGLHILREMDRMYICFGEAKLPSNFWPQMPGDTPLPIQGPGVVNLGGGWKVTLERFIASASLVDQAGKNADPYKVWLDADTLSAPLEFRTRKPGDSFGPLGLEGHTQKLSDIMVNVKMPVRARGRWPLFCSGGEIVWILGHQPAHKNRITQTTKNIMHISVTGPA